MSIEKEAALKYASLGLKVFPIYNKKPITPSGFHDASSDPDIVNAWWTGNAFAAVGIVIPDWAIVVDLDSPEAAMALDALDMDLPATLSAKSKRGRHLWYRLTKKIVRRRKIEIIPSVDLLVNGYVAAPPSKHQSGIRYEWEQGGYDEAKISDAPDWIYTIMDQSVKEEERVDSDKLLEGVPPGQRQTALFRYACSLRADPKRTKKEAEILVRAVADASGSGDYDVAKLVDRVWKRYEAKEDEPKKIKIWSLADLAKANFPPSRYIVDKIIPVGVTTVVSDPKRGKSSLIGNMCVDIARGTPVLGRFPTNQCGVLYLDLEQIEGDSLDRWKLMMRGEEWPSQLFTAFEWERFDTGGIKLIEEFLFDQPSVGLVVIDTLADFWPEEEEGSGNAYHREQRIMGPITKLCREYGVGVVLVHHNSKSKGRDFVGSVSGTTAISGKSHAIISLDRERGSRSATVNITGKKVPDRTLFLDYDQPNQKWSLTGEVCD